MKSRQRATGGEKTDRIMAVRKCKGHHSHDDGLGQFYTRLLDLQCHAKDDRCKKDFH